MTSSLQSLIRQASTELAYEAGKRERDSDLAYCPQCGGEADNGHDRCVPPTAYLCSKCMARDAEWEIRSDGARVRVDRWEWAVRRIVALLWGNRKEFECDEVVDAVRALVPQLHAVGDDEALVHAAQERFGSRDAEVAGLVEALRRVATSMRWPDEGQAWCYSLDEDTHDTLHAVLAKHRSTT